jgi:CBS domain-containing protein
MSLTEKLAERPCITIADTASIADAVGMLETHKIGALPVVSEQGDLVGILSERDIVRALATDKLARQLAEQPVTDLMTSNVVTCSAGDTASDLMAVMSSKRIRHLPIMQRGVLVGMVSIGDVVNRMIEKYQAETEMMRAYINS